MDLIEMYEDTTLTHDELLHFHEMRVLTKSEISDLEMEPMAKNLELRVYLNWQWQDTPTYLDVT